MTLRMNAPAFQERLECMHYDAIVTISLARIDQSIASPPFAEIQANVAQLRAQ